MGMPAISCGVTSAHGKHTLKYIRGITRLCCPLWKLHEFQNCRFWWEGVCSYEGEKKNFLCAPFFSSVNSKTKGRAEKMEND